MRKRRRSSGSYGRRICALAIVGLTALAALTTPAAAGAAGWTGYVVIEAERTSTFNQDTTTENDYTMWTFTGGGTDSGPDPTSRSWEQTAAWTARHSSRTSFPLTCLPARTITGSVSVAGEGQGSADVAISIRGDIAGHPFTAPAQPLLIHNIDGGAYPVQATYTNCDGTQQSTQQHHPCTLTIGFNGVFTPSRWKAAPQGTETTTLSGSHTMVSFGDEVGCSSAYQPPSGKATYAYQLTRDADPPECSDGIDNDDDGKTDYAAGVPELRDTGCESATDDSEASASTLEIRHALTPANDPGRFNLLLDAQVKASAVGNGGSTGPMVVAPGRYLVGEAVAPGTDPAAYTGSVSCREQGDQNFDAGTSPDDPAVLATVRDGANVVCTIANRRLQVELRASYAYAGALRGNVGGAAGTDIAEVVGQDAAAMVEKVCIRSIWNATATHRIATTLRMEWNGQFGPFTDGTVTHGVSTEVLRRRTTETATYEACQNGTRATFNPLPIGTPLGPRGLIPLALVSPQPLTGLSHSATVTAWLRNGASISVDLASSSASSGRAFVWRKNARRLIG